MRSLSFSLVLGVTPLLLGVAPSEVAAQRAQPMYNAPSQAGQVPRLSTADDIEVSGPLSKPPPHRAIVRLRLPHNWADVGFDGRKVDSMGQARTYVTPELSGPRTFEVTATWQKSGRTIWLMEQVTVNAGQIRTLDFTSGN